MKYIRIIWVAYCGFLTIIILLDMVDFINDPSKYPIGRELSWEYASYTNYIISSVLAILWGLLGCILGCIKKAKIFFIGHVLVSLTLTIYFLYDLLTAG